MFSEIDIVGFRALHRLRLEDLRRINLIVGENNAGKTCLLEAVELLATRGQPSAVFRHLRRRGEQTASADEGLDSSGLDPAHLFHGRAPTESSFFRLEGWTSSESSIDVKGMIRALSDPSEMSASLPLPFGSTPREAEQLAPVALVIESGDERWSAGLSATGTLYVDRYLTIPRGRRRGSSRDLAGQSSRVALLDTAGDHIAATLELWSQVTLTPKEEWVYEVLRLLEPGLRRIASVGSPRKQFSGFLALIDGQVRAPLGSLGDGFKRVFHLALALAGTTDGTLLVDEIDTGLHHSVLAQLWPVVLTAARNMNVQVFATTHSYDALAALASMFEADPSACDDFSIIRLERGRDTAVRLTPQDVRVAIKNAWEIR